MKYGLKMRPIYQNYYRPFNFGGFKGWDAIRFTLILKEGGFVKSMRFLRSKADISGLSRKKGADHFLGLLLLLRGDGRLQLYSLSDRLKGFVSLEPLWEAKSELPYSKMRK